MTSYASAPNDLQVRWRRFMRLWVGTTVSELGNGVTFVALPLLAVVMLDASPLEVGILNGLEFASYLGLSLLIGVWVDRRNRRAIMLMSDLARAVLIALIVVLAAVSWLNMWLLFVIAGLLGVFGVIFATASQAYLQQLVGSEQTTRATTWNNPAAYVSRFLGRTLAGVLAQALSVATTLIVDAISFVVSLLAVASIPASAVPYQAPKPIPKGGFVKHLKGQIAEGFGFISKSSFLRGMLRFMIHSNFLLAGLKALTVPFLLQEVGVSPGAVGIILGVGVLGAFLGSIAAEWLAGKVKPGLVLGLAATVGPLFNLLLPLTTKGNGVLWFVAGTFVTELATAIFIVLAVAHRYQIVPSELMGRVGVSMRTFFFGVIPLGAVVGGALGELFGLRQAMWIVTIGMILLPLWMIRTPAWRLTRQEVGIKG